MFILKINYILNFRMGKLWLGFSGFSRLDSGSQNMCPYPNPQNSKVLPYVAKVLGPKKRGSSCRNSAATHILEKKMEEKTFGKRGGCRRLDCSDVVTSQGYLEPPETGHKVPVLPSGLQRERGLLTPWFQPLFPRSTRASASILLRHPVCGNAVM